ncbi:MAG: hypothetical protein LWW85_06110 [Marinilabiliales bacterium]|nr:hypothetical protein [Marinilabiliales bacterium]
MGKNRETGKRKQGERRPETGNRRRETGERKPETGDGRDALRSAVAEKGVGVGEILDIRASHFVLPL